MPADLDAQTRLAEVLWKDPTARRAMQKEVARLFPNGREAMPDFVAHEEGQKTVAEVNKIVSADRQERLAEKALAQLERDRKAIMEDAELSIREDEIPHVEKLMETELIGTHRGAARLYRAQQQVATPRSDVFSSNMEVPGLNGAGGDDFNGLMDNRDKWARDKAAEILNDFRKGRGSKWE